MQFYDRTLQIRKDNLPPIHKSIAATYHNIEKLYYKQKEFTQALKYYNEASDIYKNGLPPTIQIFIKLKKI